MRPTVLIMEPIGDAGREILEASCRCVDPAPGRERQELVDADAVIVRLFPIGAAEIESAPRLRVIAKHGAGVDNIDCDAASRRGIPVLYAAGANSNAVAEHALGMMLALLRRFEAASATVRAGRPWRREDFLGTELSGRTLGIVGLGRIGTLLAKKAAVGLDMNVIAHDPYVDRGDRPFPVTFRDTLGDLLASANIVSLHVPLTDETRGMVDAAALARMRPGSYLVNTSRGAVVDGKALAAALGDGRLAGAALDVFEQEPLPPDHPLATAPNTLFTPHVAGSTREAMDAVSRRIARAILAALDGRPPPGDTFNHGEL